MAARGVTLPRRRTPRVVAFSGPSGAGKTTLLVALVREFTSRGIRVAAVKHSGHAHGFDTPGKDSDLLLRAGAEAVAVQGRSQLALFGPPRAGGVRAIARMLPAVDLILVEGWRAERVPRVEVRRNAPGVDPRRVSTRGAVALVTDGPAPAGLPTFGHREVGPLADHLGRLLGIRRRGARRGPST